MITPFSVNSGSSATISPLNSAGAVESEAIPPNLMSTLAPSWNGCESMLSARGS